MRREAAVLVDDQHPAPWLAVPRPRHPGAALPFGPGKVIVSVSTAGVGGVAAFDPGDASAARLLALVRENRGGGQ